MLYAITFEISGIYGPGGYIHESWEEVISFAKSIAEPALDQLDDAVSDIEWFDLNAEETEPRQRLTEGNADEVANMVQQISDAMKSQKKGYIDLWEYQDIFQLVKEQDVESWCSSGLRERITSLRKAYAGLVNDLSDEWAND